MRISKIHIENFKSLKDVTLNGLGDIVFLVGKNSSGKTNLLEALFMFFNYFNFIEPSPVSPITEFGSDMWYDLENRRPIDITLCLKFGATECDEIFPAEALKIVRERFPKLYTQVTLCRRIIDVKTGWRTEYVNWVDIPLVSDNKLVDPAAFCKSLTVHPLTTTMPFPRSTAAKILGKVTRNLQERVKGKFGLAKVTRDSTERPSKIVMRAPILGAETCKMLCFLKKSGKHSDEVRVSEIEDNFENTSHFKVEIREGEIFARKHDLSLPIRLIGGGNQEALILEHFLTHKDSIMAIEEVEMHLHPRLIMQFLRTVNAVSANVQIFLTTHSPAVIDWSDVGNVWIARVHGKETKFTGFGDGEEMKNMLSELDLPVSNILYADKILLVEGLLEKTMLPIFAENMGMDPGSFSIIQITPKIKRPRGFLAFFRKKPSREYRLRIWIDVARKAEIPLYILLHKEAENEVEELIKDGSLAKLNCAILSEGIEEQIPVETLVSVLNENYQLNLNIQNMYKHQIRMVDVERILRKKKKMHLGWKKLVAKKAAEKMPSEKIPIQVKKLFGSMLIEQCQDLKRHF